MMRRKGYFIINETKEMYNNEMIISDNILSNPSTLEELKEMVLMVK